MTVSAQYSITAQLHISKLSDTGRGTVDGWQITFRDAQTGVTGTVFVDDDHYLAENVDALIQEQLQRIRDVHSLTGA